MPSSFELSLDAPVSVDEILSAFGNTDYWEARLAAFGRGTATLDALTVDGDGAVSAALTVNLFRDRLPSIVTRLRGGELTIGRTERWDRTADGRARGEISVAVPGAPVTAGGEVWLVPGPRGSQVDFVTTIEIDIPLLGGQIERVIGGMVRKDIVAVQHFTNEWIRQNR